MLMLLALRMLHGADAVTTEQNLCTAATVLISDARMHVVNPGAHGRAHGGAAFWRASCRDFCDDPLSREQDGAMPVIAFYCGA